MVRRITREKQIPADADKAWNLIRNPVEFVPIWPYLEKIEELGDREGKIRLLLKRFGFSLRAVYKLEVSRDEESKIAIYRCKATDKEFDVTIGVKPQGDKVLIRLEASYSGPYESLSRPLLESFANRLLNNIANKLRPAEPAAKPPASVPAPAESKQEARAKLSLRDPGFITKAIISGTPLDSGRVRISEFSELQQLLSRIVELSKGRIVLARIRIPERGLLVRILASNGEVLDVYLEERERTEYGLGLLEKLLEKVLGSEIEYLILEVSRA